MTITAPPSLTAPPSPAPSRADSANFAARSDLYHAWRIVNGAEEPAALAWTYATALEVFTLASATQADRTLAQAALTAITAQNPVANAAAAAASAAAAAASATLAQASNPDAPVRLNPSVIRSNLTIPSGYNATSTGPITLAQDVVVTISDNTTWSIT